MYILYRKYTTDYDIIMIFNNVNTKEMIKFH